MDYTVIRYRGRCLFCSGFRLLYFISIQEHKLLELLPFVDAMNIDVKAFHEEGYRRLLGDFTTVCRNVELAVYICHDLWFRIILHSQ